MCRVIDWIGRLRYPSCSTFRPAIIFFSFSFPFLLTFFSLFRRVRFSRSAASLSTLLMFTTACSSANAAIFFRMRMRRFLLVLVRFEAPIEVEVSILGNSMLMGSVEAAFELFFNFMTRHGRVWPGYTEKSILNHSSTYPLCEIYPLKLTLQ